MKKPSKDGVPAQPPPPPISAQEAGELVLAMRQLIISAVENPDPAQATKSKELVLAAAADLTLFVKQAKLDREQIAQLTAENRNLRKANQTPADAQGRRELQRLQERLPRLETERDQAVQQHRDLAHRYERSVAQNKNLREQLAAMQGLVRKRERTLRLAKRLLAELNARASACADQTAPQVPTSAEAG